MFCCGPAVYCPILNPATPAFNPANVGALWSLSNFNRTGTWQGVSAGSGSSGNIRTTTGRSNKRYFEGTFISSTSGSFAPNIGVVVAGFSNGLRPGITTGGAGYFPVNTYVDGALGSGTPGSYGVSALLQLAVDGATGKVWFGKNNVWVGNPAAGTGQVGIIAGSPQTLYAVMGVDDANAGGSVQYVVRGRFTATDMIYSAPAGFTPWDD